MNHNSHFFQGATTLNIEDPPDNCPINAYKWGHLAMTYTGIATLVILGDDLSRLDRKSLIEGDSSSYEFHVQLANFKLLR